MNIPLNNGLELAFASVCAPGLRLNTRVLARDLIRHELSLRVWCEERHWTVCKVASTEPLYAVLDVYGRRVSDASTAAEALELAYQKVSRLKESNNGK